MLSNLWIGIGCQKGTSSRLINYALEEICLTYHLSSNSLAGFATILSKAKEPGLIQVCEERNLILKTFTRDELNKVKVPTPSTLVTNLVGTPSVAEASALLAASQQQLLVSKQIIKLLGEPKGVTVAIALSL